MIGKVVERLREERRLTQTELSAEMQRKLGRGSGNASTISMIESGKMQPRLDLAVALADFFGVSLDYLVGRTENRTPYPSGLSITVAVSDRQMEVVVREFAEFVAALPVEAARAMLAGQKGFWQAAQAAQAARQDEQ